MNFGIAELSIIPMRAEQSERSEMVSQVLFGELFELLEENEKWVRIKLIHDGYEGWIDKKMFLPVTSTYAQKYISKIHFLTRETFNIIQKEDDYGNKLIVPGSILPFYNDKKQTCLIGKYTYKLLTSQSKLSDTNIRNNLISYALQYYNTPYLWGGRSPYGIDCSGFSQAVYRLIGIELPRDASQQVQIGTDYSFVEEALSGDLAFFGDEMSGVSHVGIIWTNNRIIHASGRVRVDKIDHQGIFNEELKKYTHNLKVIKRIIENE